MEEPDKKRGPEGRGKKKDRAGFRPLSFFPTDRISRLTAASGCSRITKTLSITGESSALSQKMRCDRSAKKRGGRGERRGGRRGDWLAGAGAERKKREMTGTGIVAADWGGRNWHRDLGEHDRDNSVSRNSHRRRFVRRFHARFCYFVTARPVPVYMGHGRNAYDDNNYASPVTPARNL